MPFKALFVCVRVRPEGGGGLLFLMGCLHLGRVEVITNAALRSLHYVILQGPCTLQSPWLRTFQAVDQTKTSPEVTTE